MKDLDNIRQHFFSFKNIIGLIISIGCIYWSFTNFDFSTFLTDFKNIKYHLFITASLTLIFSVLIRSIRWSLFFKEKEAKVLSLSELFKNEMIGYFGNNILPLKLGDLLRVSIMSKNNNMSKSYLLGTVAIERIVDIVSLVLFLAIFLIFSWQSLEVQQIFSGFQFIDLANMYIYLFMLGIISIIFYFFIKNNKSLFDWALFISAFSNIKDYKKISKIIILSLLIWAIYLFNIIIISYSMGNGFSIIESILLLTFITFIMIFPSAPGTIGTFQAAIIFVMTSDLFGYKDSYAMSFSIILHAYSYITYSIIGGYFFLKSNIKVNN